MAASTRSSSDSRANRLAIRDALLNKGVTHLHYMAPLPTMALIAGEGIISYRRRQQLEQDPNIEHVLHYIGCRTLADPNVQFRRDHKVVFGRNLHDYVPLYIGLFTPMQYIVTKKNFAEQGQTIVFAEVSVAKVFYLKGICYSDDNAASNETSFYNDPSGLDAIHWDIVLYENRCWEPDLKRLKMAEVLAPDQIPPQCIDRYVLMNEDSAEAFCQLVNRSIERGVITHTDFEIVYDHRYFYSRLGGGLIPNG